MPTYFIVLIKGYIGPMRYLLPEGHTGSTPRAGMEGPLIRRPSLATTLRVLGYIVFPAGRLRYDMVLPTRRPKPRLLVVG